MHPTKFSARAWVAIFVFAATCLSASSHSFAQNPHAKIFGDWRIRCNSATGAPSNCEMFQNVVVKETNQPVLKAVVGYVTDVPTPVGVITLPLGVYLPPGLTVQIDGGQIYEMAFEICGRNGCWVRFSFDVKLLSTFKGGDKAEVAFYNASRKHVRVPVSLKGFTAAIGQLR